MKHVNHLNEGAISAIAISSVIAVIMLIIIAAIIYRRIRVTRSPLIIASDTANSTSAPLPAAKSEQDNISAHTPSQRTQTPMKNTPTVDNSPRVQFASDSELASVHSFEPSDSVRADGQQKRFNPTPKIRGHDEPNTSRDAATKQAYAKKKPRQNKPQRSPAVTETAPPTATARPITQASALTSQSSCLNPNLDKAVILVGMGDASSVGGFGGFNEEEFMMQLKHHAVKSMIDLNTESYNEGRTRYLKLTMTVNAKRQASTDLPRGLHRDFAPGTEHNNEFSHAQYHEKYIKYESGNRAIFLMRFIAMSEEMQNAKQQQR